MGQGHHGVMKEVKAQMAQDTLNLAAFSNEMVEAQRQAEDNLPAHLRLGDRADPRRAPTPPPSACSSASSRPTAGSGKVERRKRSR